MFGWFIFFFICLSRTTECSAKSDVDLGKQLETLAERFSLFEKYITDLQNENKILKEQMDMLKEENAVIKGIIKTEGSHWISKTFPTNKLHYPNAAVTHPDKDRDQRSPNDTVSFPGVGNTFYTKQQDSRPAYKIHKQKRLLSDAVTTHSALETRVAFSVSLSTRLSLGQHQAIEYDKILTNVGNAYDLRHGHFTAPVKGVYMMCFTAMNYEGTYLYLEMVKNGIRIAYAFGDSDDFSMSSQTVLVILEKGDMVWVRHVGTAAELLHEDGYNTFSGTFLFHM